MANAPQIAGRPHTRPLSSRSDWKPSQMGPRAIKPPLGQAGANSCNALPTAATADRRCTGRLVWSGDHWGTESSHRVEGQRQDPKPDLHAAAGDGNIGRGDWPGAPRSSPAPLDGIRRPAATAEQQKAALRNDALQVLVVVRTSVAPFLEGNISMRQANIIVTLSMGCAARAFSHVSAPGPSQEQIVRSNPWHTRGFSAVVGLPLTLGRTAVQIYPVALAHTSATAGQLWRTAPSRFVVSAPPLVQCLPTHCPGYWSRCLG